MAGWNSTPAVVISRCIAPQQPRASVERESIDFMDLSKLEAILCESCFGTVNVGHREDDLANARDPEGNPIQISSRGVLK